MRALVASLALLPLLAVAEPTWEAQRTSFGVGMGGRWTKQLELGGSGRALAVVGAGPAANLWGSFGWSRGALRLGGLASYEQLLEPKHDLDVLEAGPLGSFGMSRQRVTTAHFFSAGPFIGAEAKGGYLVGFADLAVLVDLTAVELDAADTRLGLRFVPTVRVGGAIDLGVGTVELWLYGSALVTPRVGLVLAVGF